MVEGFNKRKVLEDILKNEGPEELIRRLREGILFPASGGAPAAPSGDLEDLLDQIEAAGGDTDTLKAGVTAGTPGIKEALEAVLAGLQPAGGTALSPAQPGTPPQHVLDANRALGLVWDEANQRFVPIPGTSPMGEPVGVDALNASMLFPPEQGTPVAFGFDLFERTIDLLLRAEAGKRATRAQAVDIAGLLTELERVSPTRAAGFATRLGLPSRFDFSFTQAFGGGGGPLAPSIGGRIGGEVGGQQISIPGSLSGQELAFLDANPGVGNVLTDVADFLGLPDLLSRSRATLLPTSRQLTSIAA